MRLIDPHGRLEGTDIGENLSLDIPDGVNPDIPIPSEAFLNNLSDYSALASELSAYTGELPGALVFGGISAGAGALKVGCYSNHKVIDTTGEVLKLPVKPELSYPVGKAIDMVTGEMGQNIDNMNFNDIGGWPDYSTTNGASD